MMSRARATQQAADAAKKQRCYEFINKVLMLTYDEFLPYVQGLSESTVRELIKLIETTGFVHPDGHRVVAIACEGVNYAFYKRDKSTEKHKLLFRLGARTDSPYSNQPLSTAQRIQQERDKVSDHLYPGSAELYRECIALTEAVERMGVEAGIKLHEDRYKKEEPANQQIAQGAVAQSQTINAQPQIATAQYPGNVAPRFNERWHTRSRAQKAADETRRQLCIEFIEKVRMLTYSELSSYVNSLGETTIKELIKLIETTGFVHPDDHRVVAIACEGVNYAFYKRDKSTEKHKLLFRLGARTDSPYPNQALSTAQRIQQERDKVSDHLYPGSAELYRECIALTEAVERMGVEAGIKLHEDTYKKEEPANQQNLQIAQGAVAQPQAVNALQNQLQLAETRHRMTQHSEADNASSTHTPSSQDNTNPSVSLYIYSSFGSDGKPKVEGIVYRGESRSYKGPNGIFNKGFVARGNKLDIYSHAMGNDKSGYIPTSSSREIASKYANPYLYEIQASANAIDVAEALTQEVHRRKNISWSVMDWANLEKEMAVPHKIPPEAIIGVWEKYTDAMDLKREKFILNPSHPLYGPLKLWKAGNNLGKGITAVGVIIDALNLLTACQQGHAAEEGARIAGAWSAAFAAGSASGKVAAAACSPIAPPYGSIVCGFVGGSIGSAAGYWAGGNAGKFVYRHAETIGARANRIIRSGLSLLSHGALKPGINKKVYDQSYARKMRGAIRNNFDIHKKGNNSSQHQHTSSQLAYSKMLSVLRKPKLWTYPEVMQWVTELGQKGKSMPDYLSSQLGFYTYPEHQKQVAHELAKEVEYYFQTGIRRLFSNEDLAQLYARAEQQANLKESEVAGKASPGEHAARKKTLQHKRENHVTFLKVAQEARLKLENSPVINPVKKGSKSKPGSQQQRDRSTSHGRRDSGFFGATSESNRPMAGDCSFHSDGTPCHSIDHQMSSRSNQVK